MWKNGSGVHSLIGCKKVSTSDLLFAVDFTPLPHHTLLFLLFLASASDRAQAANGRKQVRCVQTNVGKAEGKIFFWGGGFFLVLQKSSGFFFIDLVLLSYIPSFIG